MAARDCQLLQKSLRVNARCVWRKQYRRVLPDSIRSVECYGGGGCAACALRHLEIWQGSGVHARMHARTHAQPCDARISATLSPFVPRRVLEAPCFAVLLKSAARVHVRTLRAVLLSRTA